MAYVAMAYIVMAYTDMAYIAMAYIFTTCVAMVHIVMAYVVTTYIVMAYTVMADGYLVTSRSRVAADAFFSKISEHADGERRGPGGTERRVSPRPLRRHPPIRPGARRSPSARAERSPKIGYLVASPSRFAADALFFFSNPFGGTPTANAEGLDRIGGWHRKGLSETRL